MSEPWTPAPGTSANIPNYLIPAILATVFCCLPVGVASIVFAAQVNGKLATGDIAGAAEASRKAKTFMFIAIGLGVVVWVIAVIMWILVFGMAAMSSR
ncbi:MAG TPA: CD225/dispanin family protein [Pyrinomonadaceae bacterium]